jgi:hypothetical protein
MQIVIDKQDVIIGMLSVILLILIGAVWWLVKNFGWLVRVLRTEYDASQYQRV